MDLDFTAEQLEFRDRGPHLAGREQAERTAAPRRRRHPRVRPGLAAHPVGGRLGRHRVADGVRRQGPDPARSS